ncbi:MAG: hypothetical protein AAF226_04960, partial [Verrucomicrobiota bacterium]
VDALETWLGDKIGRPVNLEDNRQPFLDYRASANAAKLNEILKVAESVASENSDLTVEDPHILEANVGKRLESE